MEYRTNLKTDYRVWRNNLLTTANHELSVSGLRLAEGEYVTDVVMIFGTMEPGFSEKDAPYITARVLDTPEHEARIINRAAAGGKANGEWSYDTDSWVTISGTTKLSHFSYAAPGVAYEKWLNFVVPLNGYHHKLRESRKNALIRQNGKILSRKISYTGIGFRISL